MLKPNSAITLPKDRSASISQQIAGVDWLFLPRALASLKLTVTLFVCSLILVLVGTLAQVEKSMWQVMADYFRTFFAWVEFRVFFPRTFFPNLPSIPGGFWFPGGWLLGTLLGVNLVAAHCTRFKVQAKGSQAAWGFLVMGVGILASILVIVAGHNPRGVQGGPWISYDAYWQLMRGASIVLFATSVFYLVYSDWRQTHALALRLLAFIASGGLCAVLVLWGSGQRLSDPSMRILWQLGQSLAAALVFLIGAIMVFHRRGSIATIHFGVGLLMFGELFVSLVAVEEQLLVREGTTTRFATEPKSVELAILTKSNEPNIDDVTVIPASRLQPGKTIEPPELPFTIETLRYLPNASIEPISTPSADDKGIAAAEPKPTSGLGVWMSAVPKRTSSGADSSGAVDEAAAYIKVTPKSDPSQSSIFLVSQWHHHLQQLGLSLEQMQLLPASADPFAKVTAEDKTYRFDLRPKRNYKPYSVELLSVKRTDYVGTTTAKDYSSYINLDDPTRGQRLSNYRIWMNNPLRYAGETFYQSSYLEPFKGIRFTILSVVTNAGWMIPYVSCAVVGLGMLVHFSLALQRFLSRQQKENRQRTQAEGASPGWLRWIVPILASLPILALVGNSVSKKATSQAGFDLEAFGQLPVQFEGRFQPIDTLARNSLRIVSRKQTYRELKGNETPEMEAKGEVRPAIQWLLDTMVMKESIGKQQIFRIENDAVRELLKLPVRKRMRYSFEEIRAERGRLEEALTQAQAISERNKEELTFEQRKILEFGTQLRHFDRVLYASLPSQFSELPDASQIGNPNQSPETKAQLNAFMKQAQDAIARSQRVKESVIPLLIPGPAGSDDWTSFASGMDMAFLGRILKGETPSDEVLAWSKMVNAYAKEEPLEFNQEVAKYRALLAKSHAKTIPLKKIEFENFFNRAELFYGCMVAYIVALFVLGIASFARNASLTRTAYWIVTWSLVIHTLALVARTYISGRPPITNLYSTVPFIGWAGVVLCLVLNRLYRFELLTAVASVFGFSTLFIAHNLAGDGDTFRVLQAVLDTQFWLATHVITINTGYAMPLVAGSLGIVYVLLAAFSPSRLEVHRKDLSRMIYGAVCAAMFFSFVGTVLGGLWADDSWGRFWGWDPKENGALMIVLWNAIILHARWDGMIRDRGMALLAILGNVVTTWSWFGVNELGIGLHAYGFREGVLFNLGIFWSSQLLFCGLGLIQWKRGRDVSTDSSLRATRMEGTAE
jgi:ABC-type transport system involved in cytochrome c biogenesis permease subunit